MDEKFYQQEERCGYIVSTDIKKLWGIELQSLEKLKEICKKHNLKYYATGGTLLGAVRHKGFIPWDDDIDVVMMWEDYKKLLEVAPKECQYPFFFQSYLSQKEAQPSLSRLRRSDTSGCTKWEYNCVSCKDYNKGIFIDIIPLFNIPDSKLKQKWQQWLILRAWEGFKGYEVMREIKINGISKFKPEYTKYARWYKFLSLFTDFSRLKQAYINACAKYENEETQRVGMLSFLCKNEKLMWNKNLFGEGVELPFENTTVCCPSGYEAVLTHQFGDWRIPVQGAACHEMGIFDVDASYVEKFNLK